MCGVTNVKYSLSRFAVHSRTPTRTFPPLLRQHGLAHCSAADGLVNIIAILMETYDDGYAMVLCEFVYYDIYISDHLSAGAHSNYN